MHFKRGKVGKLEIYLPTSLMLPFKHVVEIELISRVFEHVVTLKRIVVM